MDSHLARYKILLKRRKWYIRLLYHILDVTIVNSWLLYKRVKLSKEAEQYKTMGQAEFRAECLCRIQTIPVKRGRSSNLEAAIQTKNKRGPSQHVPPKDVRRDQYGHWPHVEEKKMRCKYHNCKVNVKSVVMYFVWIKIIIVSKSITLIGIYL